MSSLYVTADATAGGYEIEDVRVRFIAPLREAADAALGPARKLFDASPARAIAVNLADTFASVPALFEAVLSFRGKLQADETTRPEVLRAQWNAFTAEIAAQVDTLQDTIATGMDQLAVMLKREALPTTSDPAAVLIARQEVELALRASPNDPTFMVMIEQAERGLDVAAAVASEWGRLLLVTVQGDDDGFDNVIDAALQTSLNGPNEGQRRAAAALVATRTGRPGQKVAALPEAQAFAGFVLMVCNQTCNAGVVL